MCVSVTSSTPVLPCRSGSRSSRCPVIPESSKIDRVRDTGELNWYTGTIKVELPSLSSTRRGEGEYRETTGVSAETQREVSECCQTDGVSGRRRSTPTGA